MVAGEAGFCVVLQANDLGPLVVFYPTLVYHPHFYVCFWEFGWIEHRWTSPALVLHGRHYRLELLCRLFDKNQHGVQGQREYFWKGVLSALDHALEHCGEQLGALWRADVVVFPNVGLLCLYGRQFYPQRLCVAFPGVGTAHGFVGLGFGVDHHGHDHQIPGFGFFNHLWGTVDDVWYHRDLPPQRGPREIQSLD